MRSTPAYIDSMFDRERSVSTYMGNYLAIPHGTNESKEQIKRSALSVIRYVEPIDWDGNEVLFALGIAGYQGGHMDILSRIAIVFSDTDEVDKLVAAPSAQGALRPPQRGQPGMTERRHFGAGNIGQQNPSGPAASLWCSGWTSVGARRSFSAPMATVPSRR